LPFFAYFVFGHEQGGMTVSTDMREGSRMTGLGVEKTPFSFSHACSSTETWCSSQFFRALAYYHHTKIPSSTDHLYRSFNSNQPPAFSASCTCRLLTRGYLSADQHGGPLAAPISAVHLKTCGFNLYLDKGNINIVQLHNGQTAHILTVSICLSHCR
jgi:hypothetical protein